MTLSTESGGGALSRLRSSLNRAPASLRRSTRVHQRFGFGSRPIGANAKGPGEHALRRPEAAHAVDSASRRGGRGAEEDVLGGRGVGVDPGDRAEEELEN